MVNKINISNIIRKFGFNNNSFVMLLIYNNIVILSVD